MNIDAPNNQFKINLTGVIQFPEPTRPAGTQTNVIDSAAEIRAEEARLLSAAQSVEDVSKKTKDSPSKDTWGIRSVPVDTRRIIEDAATRQGKTISEFMNENVRAFALASMDLPADDLKSEIKTIKDQFNIFYAEMTDLRDLSFGSDEVVNGLAAIRADLAELKVASTTQKPGFLSKLFGR